MKRALVALALISSAASARVPCSGDGPPVYADDEGYAPAKMAAIEPTALATIGLTWAREAASRTAGDVARGGVNVDLVRARLGVCGVFEHFAYRLVWEPWDADERARPNAPSWGRLTDAQAAWLPWEWLLIAGGVGKVPGTRAREQPVGAPALAALPFSTVIAPDRRLGITADADAGVLRAAAGVYEGAHDPSLDAPGGLLLAARATVEPWGPVGRRAWPEFAAWTDRARPALGLSGAYLLDGGVSGWLAGADLAFAWRRLFLAGEFVFADRWPLERFSTVARGRRLGAWVEALVAPRGWFSFAARVEYFAEDLASAGRGDFVAVTGGANLHFGPVVRVQAAYVHKLHLDGDDRDGAFLLALTLQR